MKCCLLAAVTLHLCALAQAESIQLPAGYATVLPPGAKSPPEKIYRTENSKGKMPSNDWWSSLAWSTNRFAHFPHPLAVRTESAGLRIFLPNHITANKAAIFGSMGSGTNDLILGHSSESQFGPPLVDGWSDWFVNVRFGDAAKSMRVSYGHGSPFVYALYQDGNPRLLFPQIPKVWSGNSGTPVLGVTINGKPYGLFGSAGSTWSGLETSTLINEAHGKHYFSVAALPDMKEETLALFREHAYAHVTDTKVEWSYEPEGSVVSTTFRYTTKAYEGKTEDTLFVLYPHQWHNTASPLLNYSYASVRGPMKLGKGREFVTKMSFPGVLPALPRTGEMSDEKARRALEMEISKVQSTEVRDTYWEGKILGKLATILPIAEQYQLPTANLSNRLRNSLEHWLTAGDATDKQRRGLFYYNTNWGTLIGYPASYGSDTELNDHHFHYGYFIKAAAELARQDHEWAARWGNMVNLLIRDIASPAHDDPLFPFMRAMDPYAGHSWASGHARFADGNNNESSSEAMNAWCGIILWGEATGDRATRDLGIWLFTTEMNAINEYWFDAQRRNFPPGYPASVVTMVWGGKGANGTWFSANPEMVHGINFLPLHGGSLYLGLYPDYVERNYTALLEENKGNEWDAWADIIYMYRALSNPEDAIAQFEKHELKYPTEGGNSRLNTLHWIYNLRQLGNVDRTVTANVPLYSVFQKAAQRSYAVYNMNDSPRVVAFSDGFSLRSTKRGFATATRAVKQ
jgi:endoglucanase Acf2